MSVLSTPAIHEYCDELAHSLPPPVTGRPGHRERRLSTAIEARATLFGSGWISRLAMDRNGWGRTDLQRNGWSDLAFECGRAVPAK